ncbi:MAG: nucleotidyltransferase domain-containing protein [Anaerolineae bacterium]|nr:nucleotidyltransferase domain-containing protein [Anaerolineae bacterium]
MQTQLPWTGNDGRIKVKEIRLEEQVIESDKGIDETNNTIALHLEDLKLPAAAQQILYRIVAGYHPQRVIVYGSFARDDVHERSDLDLIIVKHTDERFIDRIECVLAFCNGEMVVEPLVYTPKEIDMMLNEGNSFLETALQEGITIYEA